ncbi:MAG: PEGA domain-containing protein [Deltaproteobacteria bacterium]|nr:PEGA domain-containing protein [Deltaproteobacteria bacterium]
MNARRPCVPVIAALGVAAALAAPPAAAWGPGSDESTPAGSSAEQRAAALFDEGTALYRQSRFAEAEAKFQQSWDLRQTFDAAANLGDCELYGGQHREAAEHLAFARRSLPLSAAPALRARIEQRLAEAKSHVVTLQVRCNVAGALVRLGGQLAGTTPLPGPLFADPGPIAVEVSREGYRPASKRIDRAAGTSVELDLTLAPGAPAGTTPDAGEPGWRAASPWLVGAGAVLAAGALGAGIGLRARGSAQEDDADALRAQYEQAGRGCAGGCPELRQAYADADTSYDLSTGMLVGSGVAALATVGLAIAWATSDRSAGQAPASAILVPLATPSMAGAMLLVRFSDE